MATPTNQFRLKLAPSTAYNFTVNWGDGTSEVFNQTTSSTEDLAGLTHTYSTPGVYDLTITENALSGFPRIFFNGTNNTSLSNDDVKVTNIVQWGNPSWLSMADAFEGCTNLSAVATDNNSLSGVTNFDDAWYGCTSLSSFPLINTSRGTSFSETWYNCNKLTSFPLINTSSATTLNDAWYNCNKLKSFPLINTLSATHIGGAWSGCTSLTSFPLIDTRNVNFLFSGSTGGAWQDCSSLSSFPLIDTSKVTNFIRAWQNCYSLSASDFPTLNMSKMTNGTDCFNGVKLTTNSYSLLLSSICATNINNTVTFHGGNSLYNSTFGLSARNYLVNTKGWTITDGGVAGVAVSPLIIEVNPATTS